MDRTPVDGEDAPRRTSTRARRLALFVAPWLLVAAVVVGGAIVYHSSGSGGTAASAPAVATPADDASGIVKALATSGIKVGEPATPQATAVPGALATGFTGDNVHDKGKQPTFSQIETLSAQQLLPLFPANTVTAADLPRLKQQVEAVRAAAERLSTPDAAKAAGYANTTSDVPFMGEHYLNMDLVRKGVFDPARPQGLLFSKIGPGGAEQLVGVWFLLIPGVNGIRPDVQPPGFAGNLALWHAHVGLCLVGFSGASEGETQQSCAAKGGSYTPDLRWMMHVWVAPLQDNPDGIFAYLNRDLFNKQQAAGHAATPSTGQTQ